MISVSSRWDDKSPKVGLVVQDDTDPNILKLQNIEVDNLETKQQEIIDEIEAVKTKTRNDINGNKKWKQKMETRNGNKKWKQEMTSTVSTQKHLVLNNFPRTANENMTEVTRLPSTRALNCKS